MAQGVLGSMRSLILNPAHSDSTTAPSVGVWEILDTRKDWAGSLPPRLSSLLLSTGVCSPIWEKSYLASMWTLPSVLDPDGPACLGREQDRVRWKGGYVIPTGDSMVGRTEIAKAVISSGLAQRRLQEHSRGKDGTSPIVSWGESSHEEILPPFVHGDMEWSSFSRTGISSICKLGSRSQSLLQLRLSMAPTHWIHGFPNVIHNWYSLWGSWCS